MDTEKVILKNNNGPIIRSVASIIIGLILVLWPDLANTYIVMTIGILFLLTGVFSIILYFNNKRKYTNQSYILPFTGIGSTIFGLWLILSPASFINIFMYILGALLVLAAVQQFYSLIVVRKWNTVPWIFYIFPALILIAGIVVLTSPNNTASSISIIIGASTIFYGITELVNALKFKRQ